MIDIKLCKKCHNPFDIDTSKDKCPNCRNIVQIKKEGEYGRE